MNLTCRTCGETKPEGDYYRNRGRLMTECKTCWKRRENGKRYLAQFGTTSPEPKRCERCDAELPSRRGKYCTTGDCKKRREAERRRERIQAKPRPPLPHCANCGAELSRRGVTYCSSPECQKARDRSPEARQRRAQWLIDNTERRREYNRTHKARRRTLLSNAPTDDVTWTGIMDRDNWTCHICGHHMSPDVKAPNPKAATWDHIVPLSKGGAHTWDNLRACCYSCNSRKGDRINPAAQPPETAA